LDSRSFLFLQGVASPFFDRLASALRRAGVQTCRVEFCGGDTSFNRSGPAKKFTGKLNLLNEFYNETFNELKVTDIVLFGDTRPVHIPAIELAKEVGINIHVYEEGYLRPDWITLDSGGVNAFSPFANKVPDYFRERAKNIPRNIKSFKTGYSQWTRLSHDLRFNIARTSDFVRFPNYSRHRVDHPISEYLGWFKRYPALVPFSLQAKYKTKKIINDNLSYYIYPLQLSADSQIRIHSNFSDVNHATEEILRSFEKYAPKATKLIIKNHPLDTGLSKCKEFTRNMSKDLGIEDRVIFLDGGHLPTLLQNAKGTVVVNSTTGMSALFHKSPTIALGNALFDMPGLTFQGGLNEFWCRAKRSDYKLFSDFRDVVINDTQINGNFYTRKGIAMAVAGSLKRFNVTIPEATTASPQTSISFDVRTT